MPDCLNLGCANLHKTKGLNRIQTHLGVPADGVIGPTTLTALENVLFEEQQQEAASRRNLSEGQIPFLRNKWASLSEYIKEIKQTFSRYYNRLHNRRGFFWADRFKSILVDNGDTLINCLAYIDLNPIRAGIVPRPEEYRWCSLGYHIQSGNKDDFLSLDFGLREFGVLAKTGRLAHYRRFVYEKGGLSFKSGKAEVINASAVFRSRIRYFIDGGMIGAKAFVMKCYRMFRGHFYPQILRKSPFLLILICLKTYFFFEMMTYLLVTPIIFLFCMADTTFALKRSEESGA